MDGRFRTASSPSRTLICSAPYDVLVESLTFFLLYKNLQVVLLMQKNINAQLPNITRNAVLKL
jgi:hypothetical protein